MLKGIFVKNLLLLIAIHLFSCAPNFTPYSKMHPEHKYAIEKGISAYQFINPEEVLSKTAYCRFVAVKLVKPNSREVNLKSAIIYRKLDSLFVSNKSLFINISLDYDLINIEKVLYYIEFPLSRYIISPTFTIDRKGKRSFLQQLGYAGKGTPVVLIDSHKKVVYSTFNPERDYNKIKAIVTKKNS